MIKKNSILLKADPRAVITRFLPVSDKRVLNVIKRVESLPEEETVANYHGLAQDYSKRHRAIEKTFNEHFKKIEMQFPQEVNSFSFEKRLLLGALFTMEYSIKSAALFNPSMVPHPDQSGLKEDEKRFVMSLRAIGEGHISSIIFHAGVVDSAGTITLDGEPEFFTRLEKKPTDTENDAAYELQSAAHLPMNEKVLFPSSASESMGMEDVRFVQFSENGNSTYYGTYTAYDGRKIQVQLIETTDFNEFKITLLQGAGVSDKGMALFPEKVNGKYVMISRQGGEVINIMFSDNLHRWDTFETLLEPKYLWEFLQLGNCGSPVRTEKGWLLLTHAVGPMRTYVISAILLDLEDPTKIIGRLHEPLIHAEGEEREGYVPNVVYTCGYMRHDNLLVIPYAVSDSATGFATVALDKILNEMKP